MDYSHLNDDELIQMIRMGSTEAHFILLEKYNKYCLSMARKALMLANNCRIDFDEIRQECLISVDTAIKSYDLKSHNFFIYWQKIANNVVSNAVTESIRRRYEEIGNISLDEEPEDSYAVRDVLGEPDHQMEGGFIYDDIMKMIDDPETGLTDTEKSIMKLYMQDLDFSEIAKRLKISYPKVYRLYRQTVEKLRMRFTI